MKLRLTGPLMLSLLAMVACADQPEKTGPLERVSEALAAQPASPAPYAPDDAQRARLDAMASRGFVVDIGAYSQADPAAARRDVAYIAEAVRLTAQDSRSLRECWDVSSVAASGDALERCALPRFPFIRSVAVRAPDESLPIVLLPRASDLAAPRRLDTDGDRFLPSVFGGARLWACSLLFLPQRDRIVWTRCPLPADPAGEGVRVVFPINGGPPIGGVGKLIGRPDDSRTSHGDGEAFRTVQQTVGKESTVGLICTVELGTSVWAFAAWSATDICADLPTVYGFAVPMLDGNGVQRGTSAFEASSSRGSPFENLVLNSPKAVVWGRHPLFKLPRPMAIPARDLPDRLRARARAEERIAALVPLHGPAMPAVQAFRKAETWGPFAEDVVFESAPTAEMFRAGEVRALAINASIEPQALLDLLAAMAGCEPAEPSMELLRLWSPPGAGQ